MPTYSVPASRPAAASTMAEGQAAAPAMPEDADDPGDAPAKHESLRQAAARISADREAGDLAAELIKRGKDWTPPKPKSRAKPKPKPQQKRRLPIYAVAPVRRTKEEWTRKEKVDFAEMVRRVRPVGLLWRATA